MQNPDQQVPITDTAPPSGFAGLPPKEFQERVRAGRRCVRFECCFSILVTTVRRQSAVYVTERWQERYLYGLGYSALALLLGPWGVPWGLVWTAWAVWTNLTGGIDVTDECMAECGRPGRATAPE